MTRTESNDVQTSAHEGQVKRIIFRARDSDYAIFILNDRRLRRDIKVAGYFEGLTVGIHLRCIGVMQDTDKHGRQLNARVIMQAVPKTLDGIRNYLCSELVKGIGPSTADKLLEHFGVNLLNVLDHEPERLREVEGIGEGRLAVLRESWAEHTALRDIMIFLQTYGISPSRAMRIYREYGKNAVKTIKENPYRLAEDIIGIGFQTADVIALRTGIEPASPFRVRACLFWHLQTAHQKGHMFVPQENLIGVVAKHINVRDEDVFKALEHEIEARKLLSRRMNKINGIFLPYCYKAEVSLANSVLRLRGDRALVVPKDWDIEKLIRDEENAEDITLSDEQREAVRRALTSRFSVITGGPGVGKTRTIQVILRILQRCGCRSVELCAPTGRAAKRMSETTGMPARTIHRLLAYNPAEKEFKFNEDNPLETDFLIVDECSMLDAELAAQLFSALETGSSVVMVGDVDQLESIGPGAVLADIIESGVVPVSRLIAIYRQLSGSSIIEAAHRINRGELPVLTASVKSDFAFKPVEDPSDIPAAIESLVASKNPRVLGLNPMKDMTLQAHLWVDPAPNGRFGSGI